MADLKNCKKCGEDKEYKEFSKNRRRKDGHQDNCKACIKIRDAEQYSRSKDKFAKWSKNRRLRVRKQVFTYLLTHPCVECKERDIVVLEFDHRTQTTKRFDVMSATHGHSWKTIEAEIKKCDVVCANCHKRRTAKMMNWVVRLEISAIQKEQWKQEKETQENDYQRI
ncbi:hypothetical protein LCGC14_1776470 [marine sediment metagenome]|uniref:HNH domain-containing protein n=1 Tax=marine sediment metagenome TaxID=412755 RepID=A0A0F9GWU1_9ZZZZ